MAPDGKRDEEVTPVMEKTTLGHDLTQLSFKDVKFVATAITTLVSGDPLDDKELLLEHGVELLQSLPLNSGLQDKISSDFIAMLYQDLPHPPPTTSGPSARYRKHDGSGNNPWIPEMGRAGAPYSRSVPPIKTKGPNLPDPELVYDQLLKRRGPFREHPSGLNRLFFSFATVVIHEIFQTSRTNPWINETSGYVDLSTLYGNTEKEQKRVRTYENGKLFPDSIASERIMMMPPGVVIVVLLFCRNHNHIAENILSVNEEGKYKNWDELDDRQKIAQDEDIFQVTRNINVGYFASVVLKDYVASILNTPRANSSWSLDLGKEIKQSGKRVERGTGNVVSVEFRRYLNLKPYKNFEEWNDDKNTARAAELLYGHIENLELYPGLMAENTKPAMPGSGVCPGQTTGRGILDDAVALVRGDRFLSYDFNSTTLSNFGFAKLQNIPSGSYGGILPHLLFNGLPGAWTGTSAYALLPFYTPKAQYDILKGNKVIGQYDLERPANGMEVIGIHTHEGCKKVFEDRENFRVMYQKAIRECTDGHDFMIGFDDAKRHDARSSILYKAFFEEGFEAKVSQFFKTNVSKLIKSSSLKYSNSTRRSVDIVRDVTNVAPILWLAERFAIPLKTHEKPHGVISIPEAFAAFLVLFMYQSFNIIPANEWKLREGAMKAGPILRKIFDTHLRTQQGFREKAVDWLAKGSAFEVGPEADRLYHALNDSKLPIGDLVGDCIGMGAPVAGNLTQQASLLIDLYLSEGYEEYKARIVELSHMTDAASERELQGFVFEGMRHAGVVPGLPRVTSKDITIIDGARGPIHIQSGHTILIATSKANMDPLAFSNPEKLNPHRPFDDYTLLGHGLHFCFGTRLVGCSLAATLREVFKLKNCKGESDSDDVNVGV
ncbi:putative Psi-producing oxygenase C [Glarea lozoyensis 74030]|uniref:Putative Psi-producing oxygenase C n=1 Tax=Glarea lozoyensis (strain ATCC 74030 / MF5533) TaxID=1104152 RepID=H0EQ41_GLAL7|nr:putative Psi-producing oxygenase C [Glarea lozoyensis 74030]